MIEIGPELAKTIQGIGTAIAIILIFWILSKN